MNQDPSPLRLETFYAQDGHTSARVHGPGFIRLLHSAKEPALDSKRLPAKEIWGDILVCIGTGLGYHLEWLAKEPTKPGLLVLCDHFAENCAATLKRLKGYSGPMLCLHADNAQAMGMLLRPYQHLQSQNIQTIRHPASARYCEELADQVIGRLRPRMLPAHTCKPCLALPFGNHFLQQEIVHGLQELGWEALTFPQDFTDGDAREDALMRLFQDRRPNLCLSINMKGLDREGVLASVCGRLDIPLHVWFVDDPRPIALSYPPSLFSHLRAWCWEKAYTPWLRTQGFAQPSWLPLAGDPLLFSPANVPVSPGLELVFTGSSMGSSFLDGIRSSYMHAAGHEAIAQDAAKRLAQGLLNASDLPGAFGEAVAGLDTRNASWLSSLAIHMASHAQRKAWLSPLLSLGLACAGDAEGWRDTLGSSVKTLPDLDYRTGLCPHYRRCGLQINLTSLQMPTALSQRVFDVPLSGRPLLGDYQADLDQLFPKECYAAASSPGEMREQALAYLRDPRPMQAMAGEARLYILNHHTYSHRLRTLIE